MFRMLSCRRSAATGSNEQSISLENHVPALRIRVRIAEAEHIQIPLDIAPRTVVLENDVLHVEWLDGHKSEFSSRIFTDSLTLASRNPSKYTPTRRNQHHAKLTQAQDSVGQRV